MSLKDSFVLLEIPGKDLTQNRSFILKLDKKYICLHNIKGTVFYFRKQLRLFLYFELISSLSLCLG